MQSAWTTAVRSCRRTTPSTGRWRKYKMDAERFDRQLLLFGCKGQEKIAGTRAVIVGNGGTGMHVAQQLGYIGVRAYGLIDADIVTKSSLNRLVGATPEDVAAKRPKVLVAERMIRAVEPDARITPVFDSFLSDAGAATLAQGDVI